MVIMTSRTSRIAVQCVLMAFSALLPAMATFAPTQGLRDEGYETVHEYRRRLGIEYKFTPQWVSPEMCRTISEEQCQELDASFERGVRSNRKLLEHHKQRRAQGAPSSMRILVLLVQWTNHADKPLIPIEEIDQVFNSDNVGNDIVPTGSISRYFQVNSYGKFDITADVIPWTMTDNTEEAYASLGNSGRSPELENAWTPILEELDSSGFDFSPFDQDGDGVLDLTVVLHSGYAAELGGPDCNTGATRERRIASHASSFGGVWTSTDGFQLGPYSVASAYRQRCDADVARLGVIAHEMVHTFGIPDLYNYDQQDNTSGNVGGMGRYDIMSNPYGQMNSQARPGHMSAWTKIQMGWADPIVISKDGTYLAEAAELSNVFYRIDFGYLPGEYLLLEHRKAIPFDFDESFWDPGGMIIYHIDENNYDENVAFGNTRRGGTFQQDWPGNGQHFPFAVLQRDGAYDLEQFSNGGHPEDYYYLPEHSLGPGNGESFHSTSGTYPNTDSYAFGQVTVTGLTIFNFRQVGQNIMAFDIGGIGNSIPPSASPSESFATPGPSMKMSKETTAPTLVPSTQQTNVPTLSPTSSPTLAPTPADSTGMTPGPSQTGTTAPPTLAPTTQQTNAPTLSPTLFPTLSPITSPISSPAPLSPTSFPTLFPTLPPTLPPTIPDRVTLEPTRMPTQAPTQSVTASTPTTSPTALLSFDSPPTPSPTTSLSIPNTTSQPTTTASASNVSANNYAKSSSSKSSKSAKSAGSRKTSKSTKSTKSTGSTSTKSYKSAGKGGKGSHGGKGGDSASTKSSLAKGKQESFQPSQQPPPPTRFPGTGISPLFSNVFPGSFQSSSSSSSSPPTFAPGTGISSLFSNLFPTRPAGDPALRAMTRSAPPPSK